MSDEHTKLELKEDNTSISSTVALDTNSIAAGECLAINTHVENNIIYLCSAQCNIHYFDGLLIRFDSICDAFDNMYIKLNSLSVHPMIKAGVVSFKKGDTIIIKYKSDTKVFILYDLVLAQRLIFTTQQVKDFNLLTYPANFITSNLQKIKHAPKEIFDGPANIKVINFNDHIIQEIAYIDIFKEKSYFSRYFKKQSNYWFAWEHTRYSNIDYLIFYMQEPIIPDGVDGSIVIVKGTHKKKSVSIPNNSDSNTSKKKGLIFDVYPTTRKVCEDDYDFDNNLPIEDTMLINQNEEEANSIFEFLEDQYIVNITSSAKSGNKDFPIYSNQIDKNLNTGGKIMNTPEKYDTVSSSSRHHVNNRKNYRQQNSVRRKSLGLTRLRNRSALDNVEHHIHTYKTPTKGTKKGSSKFKSLRTKVPIFEDIKIQQKYAGGKWRIGSLSAPHGKQENNQFGRSKFYHSNPDRYKVVSNFVAPFKASEYKTDSIQSSHHYIPLTKSQGAKRSLGSWNNNYANKTSVRNNLFSTTSNSKYNNNYINWEQPFASQRSLLGWNKNYANIDSTYNNTSSSHPNSFLQSSNNLSYRDSKYSSIASPRYLSNSRFSLKNANRGRVMIANLTPTIG